MRASSMSRIWRMGREASEISTSPAPSVITHHDSLSDDSSVLTGGADQSTGTLLITVMMHMPMGRRRPRRSEEEAAKIGTTWTYGLGQPDEVAVERMPAWKKEGSMLKQGCMPHVETCGICLEPFRQGDVLTALPCSAGTGCPSIWHSDCIRKWLRAEHTTGCPLCRSDVDPGAEGEDEETSAEQHGSSPPSAFALEVRAALPGSSSGNAARRMTQELIQDIPFFALFLVGDSSQDEQVSRLNAPMLAALNSLSMSDPTGTDAPAGRLNGNPRLPPISSLSTPDVDVWEQPPWQSAVASERSSQPTQLGEESGTGVGNDISNGGRDTSRRVGAHSGILPLGLPRLGAGPRGESTPMGVFGEPCGLPHFCGRAGGLNSRRGVSNGRRDLSAGSRMLSTSPDRAQNPRHSSSRHMMRPPTSMEALLAAQQTVPMDSEVPNVPAGSGHGRPSSSWRSMFSGESSTLTRIRNSLSRGPRR